MFSLHTIPLFHVREDGRVDPDRVIQFMPGTPDRREKGIVSDLLTDQQAALLMLMRGKLSIYTHNRSESELIDLHILESRGLTRYIDSPVPYSTHQHWVLCYEGWGAIQQYEQENKKGLQS